MSDDFSLLDVVSDSGPVRRMRSFLGIEVESHVCQKCGGACEPTTTYDPVTAPEYNGETPSWYCGPCDTHYYREPTDGLLTMDLYGQDDE